MGKKIIFLPLKHKSMYRTHNNGELRLSDVDKKIQLCGWVQKIRRLHMLSLNLRHSLFLVEGHIPM